MKLWYLSYADDDAWHGAVIVEADEFLEAVALSRRLKLSPGGEVWGHPMEIEASDPDWPMVKAMMNRLLSLEELEKTGTVTKPFDREEQS